MATIYRSEGGQVVRTTDAYGTYYYTADDFGQPCQGGYTSEEDAREAMACVERGQDEAAPAADLEIDPRGRRVVDCAYCNCRVSVGEAVPAADDDEGWAEATEGHDEDCEWVATRAHRQEAV